jgi:hypothetical protein
LDRVELNDKNTMLYFTLYVMEERAVPVSVSSDWELTFGNTSYRLKQIHGLPVDKDYIRDAGYAANTFRVEFPALKKKFKNKIRKGTVRGTVCGEKVEFEIRTGLLLITKEMLRVVRK